MKGTVLFALLMPTGYYTNLEFIEAVSSDMVKVLSLVLITIEDMFVDFNVQGQGQSFGHKKSVDTTIDGFGWTPWFILPLSIHNLCVEHSVGGSVFDPNDLSLPDVMNDQGL